MTKSRDLANAATALNAVTAAELGYVDGVTSAIQTQLDAKLATATATSTYIPKTLTTTTGDIIYASGANTPARLGIGTTGQVLSVSSGIPAWSTASVSGTIKQTVTGSYNTLTTTTSDTPVDTGLSLSITPTSSTSKILVIIAQSFGWLWGNSAQSGAVAGLYRDSTQINSDVTMSYGNLSGVSTDFRIYQRSGFWYLDSPATTSTITYKTMFNKRNSGATAYANRDGESFITLIEIGA